MVCNAKGKSKLGELIMEGRLYGVGVGPGDPELITLKAIRVMEECEMIAIPGENPKKSVAYTIAKEACPCICKKEHLMITTPMTKDKMILRKGYELAAEKIESALKQGKSVALLTLGDPTIYSTYIYIHRIVRQHGYEAEIVSGVPSFCAVAATMGDSLVDRNMQLHVIPASYQNEEALGLQGTKVFMKAGSKFHNLRQQLMERDCESVVIENCGMEDERIYRKKKEYPDEASYYTIVVVKE